ncbi:MAG TPA: HD domain-containing protein [Candidatus Paceibacterota bacterium]|nr:HD domain-containing protein [Candidatus Paceibacterota bacterium]
MSEIINEVIKFVEEECNKPTSNYGYDAFDHLIHVKNYAEVLAKRYEADLEVVILAALLYDIGSIRVGRENHHIEGIKITEKKLKELNYHPEKIELVKKCIFNHRGSVNNLKETKEEIIADADSMVCFDNIDGLFSAALVYEKKQRLEAKKSVLNKIKNSWNKLSFKESKIIIKPKYEAALLLLT